MESRIVQGVTVAMMPSRIDANSAASAEKELVELIENGAETLLCDFSQTTYISSAGLRTVLAAAKAVKQRDGKIALFALSDYIHEIFDMAGFLRILDIHADEEAAFSAL